MTSCVADLLARLDGQRFLRPCWADSAGEEHVARGHEDRVLAVNAILEIALGDVGLCLRLHIAARTAFRHDSQFRRVEINLRPCDASVLHLEWYFADDIAQRRDADIFAGRQLRLESGVIGSAGIDIGGRSGPVSLVEIPSHFVAVAQRGAAIEHHGVGHDIKLRCRLLRPQWRRQCCHQKNGGNDMH